MSINKIKINEKVHYIASTTFTIDKIYSDLKLIGKGSYGIVCSSIDLTTGEKIAIKKITPMAKDIIDAKHVLREIRLMRHMGKHENIISLHDLIVREAADELYIIMELLDSDLHRVLQSPQILTQSHYRFFLHQLLCGVKYLHDNRIIHRDLKPGNLLVSRDCKLRITDFGLARERPTGKGPDPDDNIDEPMTEHVVTRWYRPPELMLCPDGLYTYAVDMWSVGCILAEMLGRRPIFPGKNFIDQLTLIFDVIGSPTDEEVSHIQNSQAKKYLASQKSKRPVPFSRLYPDSVPSMHDILTGLLLFEPTRRLTVDECLTSPLFANMGPSPSTEYPTTSPSFEFSFERSKATKLQLKALIVQEANEIHREYLAKKSQRNNGNDNINNSSKISQNESQTKKRSNSTGRSIPSTSSSNLNGRNNSKLNSSSKPSQSNQQDIHDDEDNASKHSYRSEVTSSSHGTINRSSRNRGGIADPKDKDKTRAQSTGRAQVSGIQPTYPSEDKYESSPRRYSAAPTSRPLKQENKKTPNKEEKEQENNYDQYNSSNLLHQTYHQIQSPSRKNKIAMTELDNEEFSKKAMSYLSQNNKPTYPKPPTSDDEDEDNYNINDKYNYNHEHNKNNINNYKNNSSNINNNNQNQNQNQNYNYNQKNNYNYGDEDNDDDNDNDDNNDDDELEEQRNYHSKNYSSNKPEEKKASSTSTSTYSNYLSSQNNVHNNNHNHLKYGSDDSESVDDVDMNLSKPQNIHSQKGYQTKLTKVEEVSSSTLYNGNSHGNGSGNNNHDNNNSHNSTFKPYSLLQSQIQQQQQQQQQQPIQHQQTRQEIYQNTYNNNNNRENNVYLERKDNLNNASNQTRSTTIKEENSNNNNQNNQNQPLGAGVGANNGTTAPKKKILTVPKSPQFSKMSWQKKESDRPSNNATNNNTTNNNEFKKKKSETGFIGVKPSGTTTKVNNNERRYSGTNRVINESKDDDRDEEIRNEKNRKMGTKNTTSTQSNQSNQRSTSIGRMGRYYC